MENIPVLIIGNKIDLIDLRVVSKQEAAEFTYSNNNFLKCLKISLKWQKII